jgi:polyisoprenyl-teichoic acid--peptidoglycan teichoic acid transferase
MDEHKKFGKPAKRPASIDGMISGGRQLGVPVHRSYQPGRIPDAPALGKLDRRDDGFHALRQSPNSLGGGTPEAAETAALLDEPILLDDVDTPKSKKEKKHYYGQRHPKARKVLKRGVMTLLALVLVGGAYFGFKIYNTERHLFRGGGKAPALAADIDINQLKGEGDGRVNVLLLGIGGPGHDGPDLTDTILLASIDPINNKAALLSIPRDLWVKIPGYGYQKINAAYAYGKEYSKAKTLAGQEADGLALLDKTLEPIIGIPIHYHVVVDFAAFQDVVDNLGGVTVNVPTELYDPTIAWQNHGNPVIAKPGVQVMNGAQALLYARSRETSSDFARGQRQRALIVAIKSKALTAGTFANPIKISDLLSSLGDNVFTDLSLNDTSRLYQITSQISSSQITSLDFVTPPNDLVTTGSMDGLSIDEPRAGLFDYSDIQNFVRTNLRDGFLAKENAPVAVYNATSTSGLATTEAALLKSYGYNLGAVGDAGTANPPTTVLVDLSKGKDKYTRHYLEERFGVTARTSLPGGSGITPPANTAFVIILGEDVANSSQ